MREPTFVGIDVSKEFFDVAVRPDGTIWRFPYSSGSLRALVKRLQAKVVTLIVIEATGGLEQRLVIALESASMPLAIVNPRQVRQFAGVTGVTGVAELAAAQLCVAGTDYTDVMNLGAPVDAGEGDILLVHEPSLGLK